MNLEALTIDSLPAHLGTRFTLPLGDGAPSVALVLESVEAWGPAPASPRHRQPFAVTFLGPVEPLLPQATYRLGHDVLGTHDIFIVPIGQTPEGTCYEAVFS